MRKLFLAVILICIRLFAQSQTQDNDSVKRPFIKNFNLSTAWFEYGYYFPIHEKNLLKLPYGMSHYFYDMKGTTASGFFSLGLYYKEKLGVEVLYRQYDANADAEDFTNYISELYPGYYVPPLITTYYFSLNDIQYRLCYRIPLKRFTLEPKFQLGINDYKSYGSSFTLKEKGSNQYISYNITNVNLNKNNFSYHFILNASKRFNPFKSRLKIETALKLEYMMVPTNYQYTIEQISYGKPPVYNVLNVKQLNPAIGIEGCVYFFFKK